MAVGTLYQKPLDAIELEPHRIQLANIPYNPTVQLLWIWQK
jgi:hypothetical protein